MGLTTAQLSASEEEYHQVTLSKKGGVAGIQPHKWLVTYGEQSLAITVPKQALKRKRSGWAGAGRAEGGSDTQAAAVETMVNAAGANHQPQVLIIC